MYQVNFCFFDIENAFDQLLHALIRNVSNNFEGQHNNVKVVEQLGSIITNVSRCTKEMKASTAMEKYLWARKNFITGRLSDL